MLEKLMMRPSRARASRRPTSALQYIVPSRLTPTIRRIVSGGVVRCRFIEATPAALISP